MYNRYMNDRPPPKPQPPPPPPPAPPPPLPPPMPPHPSPLLPGLPRLPHLDRDTVLLLVMVYFLVADPDDRLSDTLLIIAAVFLLGI